MYAKEDNPYLCPINRAINVRMTLKMIDKRMDVAKGIIQVIFFPWITKSPGSLPRGILILEAK
jgi:hypothetical protein